MSFWSNNEFDEGEEDPVDADEEGGLSARSDRILFLVDARSPMHTQTCSGGSHDGESYLKNCLSLCLGFMKSKIIADERCSIGLSFFGVDPNCTFIDREGNTEYAQNGILPYLPLAPTSLERIRSVMELIESLDSGYECDIVPMSDSDDNGCCSGKARCLLKPALWQCAQAFGSKDSRKGDLKRIWVFTNDDDPYGVGVGGGGAAEERAARETETALTVARDVAQSGVEISLWYLNPAGRTFQLELFYERLLAATINTTAVGAGAEAGAGAGAEAGAAEEGDSAQDGAEGWLEDRTVGGGWTGFDRQGTQERRKEHRKRRMGSLLFSLAPLPSHTGPPGSAALTTGSHPELDPHSQQQQQQQHMAVLFYKIIAVSKKPAPTVLKAETNVPALARTVYLDTATGAEVQPDEVDTAVDIGGVTVPLSMETVAELRQADCMPAGGPQHQHRGADLKGGGDTKDSGHGGGVGGRVGGVQLLCFLPRAELGAASTMDSSYFLFPDEAAVQGSAARFEALLRCMQARNLAALVRFQRSPATAPFLAALLPQLETLDCDGGQVDPPGMHLLRLPYSEEVRVCPAAAPAVPLPPLSPAEDPGAAALLEAARRLVSDSELLLDRPVVKPERREDRIEGEEEGEGEEESALVDGSGAMYDREMENPAVQRYYSVLQAVALQQERPEWRAEEHDSLRPDPTRLYGPRAQAALQVLQAVLASAAEEGAAAAGGASSSKQKRGGGGRGKAEGTGGAPAAKRAKKV